MTFAKHITRVPRPFDSEAGRDASRLFPDVDPDVRAVIEGAAGCSPYLAMLLKREPLWVQSALEDPEAALRRTFAFAVADPSDIGRRLRAAKRRIALLTALADLAGVWTLEKVTSTLTHLADAACGIAVAAALAPLARRGKVPGITEETPLSESGFVMFAMGKMGAGELNYSSDIDLIVLYDPSRFDADDYGTVRAGFVRAMRTACATLSDISADGYVFRTDLRLRPDPSVTPIVLSMDAAERYYESLGRTWERAAWIKARPCAGDIAAGERFQTALAPFVWRKHLDFAAIQDAHDMRLAIRDHKGTGGPITLPGHNMKLGRGGIREIEFFTQTRQLIAGGRDATLRTRGTVESLERLGSKGWIDPAKGEELADHYRFHRTVEHRVQMVRDAQTHDLPRSGAEFVRLAAMMDREPDDLKDELRDRLSAVHSETEGFFAPASISKPAETQEKIISAELLTRWRTYPALRAHRSSTLFDRIEPRLEEALSTTARPQEALTVLDTFLSRLPAGVQLFSLFDANPSLIDLLVDIAGTSPALARHLSQNGQVFDAVIGGEFFSPWPGQDALLATLQLVLDAATDYEAQLDATRRWAKEWHFRIGVHLLRDLISPREAGQQYSDLARATLRGLWSAVQVNFAQRHGPVPGRGAAILGMGSLGLGHLTPSSDLDLILIYDAADAESSDGPRPLAARPYYARLTQALITALTVATAEGKLYEVDMRLRPSGNQGPVATSWPAFQEYQNNSAWLWEHLALTRACVIAGPDDLPAEIETFRQSMINRSRDTKTVFDEVQTMRDRIFAAKVQSAGAWEIKTGSGRIQDIELLSQAGLLLAKTSARDTKSGLLGLVNVGLMQAATAETLAAAHALQTRVQMSLRLIGIESASEDSLGAGGAALLMRATGHETFDASALALQNTQSEAAVCIDEVLAVGR